MGLQQFPPPEAAATNEAIERVEEQNSVLNRILKELKIMNIHNSVLTDLNVSYKDINSEDQEMSDTIKDGTGSGHLAKVTENNEMVTKATAVSLQHTESERTQSAYQVQGTVSLSVGTAPALHIENTNQSDFLIITYIRHQVLDPAGGTNFPNASNYFRIALGRTRLSGGTEVTPVNIYSGSGNTANATCYEGATLEGTAREIDRWYAKAEGDMNVFNKEGALIIPPGETMECSFVGDQTTGTLYSRVSFVESNT